MKMNCTPNIFKVFWLKEKKFWKRTWTMHTKFNWFGKIIVFIPSILLIGIFHYAFALMHFGFELFLSIVIKDQFIRNMFILQKEALI